MVKFVLLNMLSIALIGTGNVATHLFDAFTKVNGIQITEVFGRNLARLKNFETLTKVTNNITDLGDADIYLIAVSDDAIAQVAEFLKNKNGLVVHTSGSVNLSELPMLRRGVFYPLQSFTKGKTVDFSEIPICIETENDKDLLLLESLGKSISTKVHHISSAQREKLHLAAVLVNNFTNHLFGMAQTICEKNDIPFHLLWPLIDETVEKIKHVHPNEAQTGPARRNDIETMQYHLEQLDNPLQKKIYQLLSESIKGTYGN